MEPRPTPTRLQTVERARTSQLQAWLLRRGSLISRDRNTDPGVQLVGRPADKPTARPRPPYLIKQTPCLDHHFWTICSNSPSQNGPKSVQRAHSRPGNQRIARHRTSATTSRVNKAIRGRPGSQNDTICQSYFFLLYLTATPLPPTPCRGRRSIHNIILCSTAAYQRNLALKGSILHVFGRFRVTAFDALYRRIMTLNGSMVHVIGCFWGTTF